MRKLQRRNIADMIAYADRYLYSTQGFDISLNVTYFVKRMYL